MKPLLLLPVPKRVEPTDGRFGIAEKTRIFLTPGCDESLLDAASSLSREIRLHADRQVHVDRLATRRIPTGGIGFIVQGRRAPSSECYRLRIETDRVEIVGPSPTGVFYGVQTLIQLVRLHGARLPAMRIEDEPDFRWRGFMLDVSRGRVPTLGHLRNLVVMLSHFKINMLQLYVEHPFDFRSHPEIARGCDPLEPDEILELDRWCRARHVELVPSLQSFGHMGRILSLPKFRHLAEIVQFDSWEKASWHQRMHGMTITPVDRGTYRLLADLYGDFLPLFSSRLFNLNSDETWDLGKGRSAALAKRIGVGRLYLRHITRLAALAHRHGRTPMIWADVVYQHPEIIGELPEDLILLDWNYSHDGPFDRCERIAEHGRPFLVCPGTSGWDQLFNDVWNANLNVRRFAAAGKRHGAEGVLVTDWGDCGHFNMPACSFHGAVLGAAMAWNEGRPDDKSFDRAFSLHVFGDRSGAIGRAIRRAGNLIRDKVGKHLDTWSLWASPVKQCRPGRAIAPDAAVAIFEETAEISRVLDADIRFREKHSHGWAGWIGLKEIRLGVDMLHSLAMRALADHRRLGLAVGRRFASAAYGRWADDVERLGATFGTLWRLRSKPSGLRDILEVFQKQVAAARRMGSARKRG